jgi:hypothetical protein
MNDSANALILSSASALEAAKEFTALKPNGRKDCVVVVARYVEQKMRMYFECKNGVWTTLADESLARSKSLRIYIVYYEERPERPLEVEASTALDAAQLFAAREVNGQADCMVIVRSADLPEDERKFSRKDGHWKPIAVENNHRKAFDNPAHKGAISTTSLTDCPLSVKSARLWIIVPMYIALAIVITMSVAGAGILGLLYVGFSRSALASGTANIFAGLGGFYVGLALVFLAVTIAVHWGANRLLEGAEWARIVFIVLLALGLLNNIPSALFLIGAGGALGFFIGVGLLVINFVPLVKLSGRESSDWFRRMRLLRDKNLMA